MIDPFRHLPTSARLAAAALFSVPPLGLGWRLAGFVMLPGYVMPGTCSYAEPGTFCTQDTYVPGTFNPGHTLHGSQVPARLFLLAAAVALAVVATRVRTATTQRVARLATGALAVAAALALADRATVSFVCLVLAFVLGAPPAWRRRAPAASG